MFSQYFSEYKKPAVALSGGVDSAVLLAIASKHCSNGAYAYFVKTAFQPDFELTDATDVCKKLGVKLNVIELDLLSDMSITSNPENRCYFCKKAIFSAIVKKAEADGCDVVFDGTNGDDDISDRPGFKALKELGVMSPLYDMQISKSQIRALANEFDLPVSNKPSYACLSTRIPTGMAITSDILVKTEIAESFLFSFGFTDFRVRYRADDTALIQINADDFKLLCDNRNLVYDRLSALYNNVHLDLKER